MSNIKQVIQKSSFSQFPVEGSEGIIYIDESQTCGKAYYWKDGAYHDTLGDLGSFSYSNVDYPSLNTIKKALDHILSATLSVSFEVNPGIVYIPGLQSVTLEWRTNRSVSLIDSVVIDHGIGEVKNTMVDNYGVVTVDVNITTDTQFNITITSGDEVITKAVTLNYGAVVPAISLWEASPVSIEKNVETDLTFNFACNLPIEQITSAIISNGIDNYDVKSLLSNGESGSSGTKIVEGVQLSVDRSYDLTIQSYTGAIIRESLSISVLLPEALVYWGGADDPRNSGVELNEAFVTGLPNSATQTTPYRGIDNPYSGAAAGTKQWWLAFRKDWLNANASGHNYLDPPYFQVCTPDGEGGWIIGQYYGGVVEPEEVSVGGVIYLIFMSALDNLGEVAFMVTNS